MKNTASGTLFLAGFGALWMIVWCIQRRGLDLPTLALILFAGAAIALRTFAHRARPSEDTPRRNGDSLRSIFRWVNVVQWVAIVIANLVLNASGHGEWFIAAVILIVGLHFFPLAYYGFAPMRFVLTGLALVSVALSYPWFGAHQPGFPAGAFATGVILWIAALAS